MAGMSKTPDETKHGLVSHTELHECLVCTYRYKKEMNGLCVDSLLQDALALIQQLESQNAELLEKVKQLERERDAAIYDLKKARECRSCKHIDVVPSEQPCKSCGIRGRNYEWRGPCEENGGGV